MLETDSSSGIFVNDCSRPALKIFAAIILKMYRLIYQHFTRTFGHLLRTQKVLKMHKAQNHWQAVG